MGKKILHLADLHLGASHAYLEGDATTRSKEADGVLDRIADWLLDPGGPDVGAVLIAGDLFDDPWPEDALASRAVRAIHRMLQGGIAVATVPGNHDELTYTDGVYQKWGSNWPGILVTQTDPAVVATLDLDGLTVDLVACAFHQGRNRPSSGWAPPLEPRVDPLRRRVGLFHGTLDTFSGLIAEGERAFRLDFARLEGWGLDYLALGHIHRRSAFDRGGCRAIYPGPVEGTGFHNTGSRLLTVVDLSERPPRIELIDAAVTGARSREVQVLEVDLARMADAASLERKILESVEAGRPEPIVRVVLSGRSDFAFDPAEMERALGSLFLRLEIASRESAASLGDWESLAFQRTIEGIFVKRVIEQRAAESEERGPAFWDRVAQAGLRALGRDKA